MANLAFPQLSSGAMIQYPMRKQRVIQSPLNAFADGSMLASNLNGNSQILWELAYRDLTSADQLALMNFFTACQGPFYPFIFIDPAGNMLSFSSNLTIGSWQPDSLLSVTGGAPDPFGGNNAFTLTNSSQIDQQITQAIAAPASFQYCLSVYASAAVPTSVSLGLTAGSPPSQSSQSQSFSLNPNWARLAAPIQLSDNLTNLTAALTVPAAQTVTVFGPQLEPQPAPSRYRATAGAGAVYQNAHLLGDSLTFQSDAPGLFSTFISIETT